MEHRKLESLYRSIERDWLSIAGLPANANTCVFAARVLREAANLVHVRFTPMPCRTSIHSELPDVDNPPTILDAGSLVPPDPEFWPWHMLVFLGPIHDAWMFDLTAGQFASEWPTPTPPGPAVRGPSEYDIVIENDVPQVVTYAQAGLFVLHKHVPNARAIDLTTTAENEHEIASRLLKSV